MNTLRYFDVRSHCAPPGGSTCVRSFSAEEAAEAWAEAAGKPAPGGNVAVIVRDEDGGETRWRVTARVKTVYSAWREED